ncbi:MAG: class I SAM-dependent methyltransferase [Candidatus Bathyarchaeia archaeon]
MIRNSLRWKPVMTEWNHILRRPEYAPEEPDELIINITKSLRKRKALKVLDLGCGAGRHVVYMAMQFFEAYGADISETGLKKTRERLRANGLNAFLVKCDMKLPPFIDSCFDVVICLNTIYHQRFKEMQQTIGEIHRILKSRGLFMVNFHSKRSHRYGSGIKVEENTFMDKNGPEKGVLHHFVDEDELKQLFRNFRIIERRLNEQVVKGYLRSLWEILAEKSKVH